MFLKLNILQRGRRVNVRYGIHLWGVHFSSFLVYVNVCTIYYIQYVNAISLNLIK